MHFVQLKDTSLSKDLSLEIARVLIASGGIQLDAASDEQKRLLSEAGLTGKLKL